MQNTLTYTKIDLNKEKIENQKLDNRQSLEFMLNIFYFFYVNYLCFLL